VAIQYATPLDRTFHALGDESRRRILATISRVGRCSAGELVELFDTSQPTVSKHLRVLESAGLVARCVEGRRHFFTLEAAALQTAESWLRRHLSFWEKSLDQLGDYLDASEGRGRK
jgi:DNA-binding transcriptional ArsR family regulator